jgi:hypothetical protein
VLVALAWSTAAATSAAPVATSTLSLTLAAIAKVTELGRVRGGLGVVRVEYLQRSHRCVGAERDLLQDQLILDLMEVWERRVAHDGGSKMIVLLVQPSKDIEDEVAVEDHAAEVTEGVGCALHLATVVPH